MLESKSGWRKQGASLRQQLRHGATLSPTQDGDARAACDRGRGSARPQTDRARPTCRAARRGDAGRVSFSLLLPPSQTRSSGGPPRRTSKEARAFLGKSEMSPTRVAARARPAAGLPPTRHYPFSTSWVARSEKINIHTHLHTPRPIPPTVESRQARPLSVRVGAHRRHLCRLRCLGQMRPYLPRFRGMRVVCPRPRSNDPHPQGGPPRDPRHPGPQFFDAGRTAAPKQTQM